MSPVFSRYVWSASSTKTVSIFQRDQIQTDQRLKIWEPEEGVSGLPNPAFPRQDCQKRFPHRFARSGLTRLSARRGPRAPHLFLSAAVSQLTGLTRLYSPLNTAERFSGSKNNIRTDSCTIRSDSRTAILQPLVVDLSQAATWACSRNSSRFADALTPYRGSMPIAVCLLKAATSSASRDQRWG